MHNIILLVFLMIFQACTRNPSDTQKPLLPASPDQRQMLDHDFPLGENFLNHLRFAGSIEIEIFKIVEPQFKQTQKIPSQLMILSQLIEEQVRRQSKTVKTESIFYNCKKIKWAKKSEFEINISRTCEKTPQVIATIKKINVNEYQINFVQNEWQSVIGDSALLNQKDKSCRIILSNGKVHELTCEDTLLTLGTGTSLEEMKIKKYKFNRTDKNQIVLSGGRYKDYIERSKIDITVPDEGKIKFKEIELAIRDDFAPDAEKKGMPQSIELPEPPPPADAPQRADPEAPNSQMTEESLENRNELNPQSTDKGR